MGSRTPDVRHDVAWLPIVRWVTVALLWVLLAVGLFLSPADFPLRAIAPFVLAAAVARTVLLFAVRALGGAPIALHGLAIAIDVLLLTALVDITGGPFNPFIVMFGAYVWLAWVTVSPRWGLLTAAVSVAGLGWLVVDHLQAMGASHHRLNDLPTHLFTMWFAGAAIAELVSHYVANAEAALAQRQQQLDEARARAARSEHLASLTTLAAGAAHELSTPLATIAVAARELERASSRPLSPDSLPVMADDARLIRTEVDRCQVILDRMSGRAGQGSVRSAGPLPAPAIAELAASALTEGQRARLNVSVAPDARPAGSGAEIAQALGSLLKNAFDASPPGAAVDLRVSRHGPLVRLEVEDRGSGMPADVLRRAGEPFYTTKEPGRGLGLGLFLARTFAERSGGALHLHSDQGTIATLEVPADGVSSEEATR